LREAKLTKELEALKERVRRESVAALRAWQERLNVFRRSPVKVLKRGA
jgi:hypothetical protein